MKRIIQFFTFIPSYDEMSLSLISVAFLILVFTNPTQGIAMYKHMPISLQLFTLLSVAFFVAGMGFSIYHVFTTRQKTAPERLLMFFFAIMANYASCILAGVYIFKSMSGWVLVFPILNIINGIILTLRCGFNFIDEYIISDEDVTIRQMLIGLLAICFVLVMCQNVFHLYWGLTFSICVTFATSLSSLVRRVYIES